MALTNVQNEFLKMQLANNPEFKANYFPNVLTQGPVGPLHNVNPLGGGPNVTYDYGNYIPTISSEDMPKGPLHSVDPTLFRGDAAQIGQFEEGELGSTTQYHTYPEYLNQPRKAAQFTDTPVTYDTPGSRINIRTTNEGKPVGDVAHIYSNWTSPESVAKDQTSALYMNPNILKDFGTDPSSPRNEMVNTPKWYTDYVDPNAGPTINQADINAFVTGVAGHEVGHGVALGKPEYEHLTKQGRNVNYNFETGQEQNIFPSLLSQEAQDVVGSASGHEIHTTPYVSDQDELWNRILDLERIKMQDPKNFQSHPMWGHFMDRARSHFAENTGFMSGPKRFRPKFETYYKHVKPSVIKYLQRVTGEDGPGGGAWSPSGADLSPGGGPGQSPTGSDIQGTPFSRGGILGAF